MKSTILGVGLVLVLSIGAFAQKVDSTATSAVNNKTSISKNGSGATLESGTQIAAQLQNSLDVKKAKVGDQVILKTTKAIKQNGQVVVDKGANLIGRVTEVQQKAKGNAASKVSMVFDTIQQGKLTSPISATIVSLTQTQARANVNDDQADVFGSSSTGTQTRTSSSGSSGGGLLGGVTNTVGNAVNTTTNTVGSVVNTTGQTVGNTTNAVGGTLKGIQITQSADVSAQGSSTLSLNGGNLQLDKGTTFNLRLTESASVGRNPNN